MDLFTKDRFEGVIADDIAAISRVLEVIQLNVGPDFLDDLRPAHLRLSDEGSQGSRQDQRLHKGIVGVCLSLLLGGFRAAVPLIVADVTVDSVFALLFPAAALARCRLGLAGACRAPAIKLRVKLRCKPCVLVHAAAGGRLRRGGGRGLGFDGGGGRGRDGGGYGVVALGKQDVEAVGDQGVDAFLFVCLLAGELVVVAGESRQAPHTFKGRKSTPVCSDRPFRTFLTEIVDRSLARRMASMIGVYYDGTSVGE
jgi:hypothetical protein